MNDKINDKATMESLQNVNSLDDIDFTKVDIQRGTTPEDIADKCLTLCKNYLSGDWSRQSANTIEVERISGGLTNQMYRCAIKAPDLTSHSPQEVVIRLYGNKFWDTTGQNRLQDVIVGTIVSIKKLGPHVHCFFNGGQILKYYKHHQFVKQDQSNDSVVRQVFSKLAQIHALDVPIRRSYDWVTDRINQAITKVFREPTFRKELEDFKCQTLLDYDYTTEVEWCDQMVKDVSSPLVFTHNDFKSFNLMVTEPDQEVVPCDFEYACYGYRGHDFANLFGEWGRQQLDIKNAAEGLPSEDMFGPLLQIYASESERIFGKQWSDDPINSVHHIYREIRVHQLSNCLLGIAFMVDNTDQDKLFPLPRKLAMEFAELTFSNYLSMKKQLFDEMIID